MPRQCKPTNPPCCKHCSLLPKAIHKVQRSHSTTTTAPRTRSFQRYYLRSSHRHSASQQLFDMDDLENTRRDRDVWGNDMEEVFIDMLYDDSIHGRLKPGKITSAQHTTYAERLTALNVRVFDAHQVAGKITRLKSQLLLFLDLMGQTGMGWDRVNNTVDASDKAWKNAIKVKLKWGRFYTSGLPRYEDLCTIFGASIAYGTLQHTSTQPPLDSDEEHWLDFDMRARRGPTDASRHRPHDHTDYVGLGKGSTPLSSNRCKGKMSQKDAIMTTCQEISVIMSARRKRWGERADSGSEKRSKGSDQSLGSNAGYNPLQQCMTFLNEMSPRLEGPTWYRAVKELCDPTVQQAFLMMDPAGRELWLRNC